MKPLCPDVSLPPKKETTRTDAHHSGSKRRTEFIENTG
jgi:hypothetical protein